MANTKRSDIPHVDDYEIIQKLGAGGFGSVYLAKNKTSKRQEALKFAHVENKEMAARFIREAEATAKLDHPHIVRFWGSDMKSEIPFLKLEYCSGGNLQDKIDKGNLSGEESDWILVAISEALDYAHSNGVIHRDLKPANVLFREDDTPVVADFGIAKIHEAANITGPYVLGSENYMSPEQMRGEVCPATDYFALGVIANQLAPQRYKELSTALSDPNPDTRPSSATEVAALMDTVKNPASGGGAFQRVSSWFQSNNKSKYLWVVGGVIATTLVGESLTRGIDYRTQRTGIAFETIPPSASIHVDGTLLEQQPHTFSWKLHELLVINPGYIGQKIDFEVTKTTPELVQLRLEPRPQTLEYELPMFISYADSWPDVPELFWKLSIQDSALRYARDFMQTVKFDGNTTQSSNRLAELSEAGDRSAVSAEFILQRLGVQPVQTHTLSRVEDIEREGDGLAAYLLFQYYSQLPTASSPMSIEQLDILKRRAEARNIPSSLLET